MKYYDRTWDPTKSDPPSNRCEKCAVLIEGDLEYLLTNPVNTILHILESKHTFISISSEISNLLAILVREIGGDEPIPNLVLGVRCSTQAEADRRIPALLECQASKRIVVIDPMVEAVDLCGGTYGPNFLTGFDTEEVQDGEDRYCREITGNAIDGVIVGGEIGPNARPLHRDWVRSVRDQCADAGAPFYFKVWGEWREPLTGEEYDTSNGRGGNPPALLVGHDGNVHCFHSGFTSFAVPVISVGVRRSGRLLDGREHNDLCWEVKR